jgi:hypothetical protein
MQDRRHSTIPWSGCWLTSWAEPRPWLRRSPLTMTPADFRALMSQKTDSELLLQCLHDDGAPYVFHQHPSSWDHFRDEIVGKLNVTRSDIRIVGSGRLGFSLKPGKDFRPFRDTSDIDVVVVNPTLFDQLWLLLLAAAYPRGSAVHKLGGWLKRVQNELYTGWLSPVDIKLDATIFGSSTRPVLEFRAHWFDALKRASQHPSRRHEDIQGRLYRTWRHAELYHLDSLAALRRSLLPESPSP